MLIGLDAWFLLLFPLMGLVILAILAFEIWMFVDAIRNPRLSDTEKFLWCLGMLLLHPIIAIIYYCVARRSRKSSRKTK